MSLQKLADNWLSFSGGLKWRCVAPHYFCEVQNAGNIPVYSDAQTLAAIRQVRNFYMSRVSGLGVLDASGYGIDVLVANSFAESGGKVPSPLNTTDLQKVLDNATGNNIGAKLDGVARYVQNDRRTKALVRFEPGYKNPINTPGKVSLGAQQQLVSTAAWLQGINGAPTDAQVQNLVLKMPTDSKFTATLAATYFNKSYSKHNNQPPLMAACYNAGSLRESNDNPWKLRCTNNHIDRWVKYFNMSRSVAVGTQGTTSAKVSLDSAARQPKPAHLAEQVLPPAAPSNVNTKGKFSVEQIVAALNRKNINVRATDDKNYNLNIVGIRNSNARVNFFDDTLFVFWKFNGQYFTKQYHITTYPGLAYLGEKPANRLGTAILREGYYPGSHQIGFHKVTSPNRYEALVQRGNLTVYRDNNHDNKFDLKPSTLQTGNNFGVNIHHARAGGITVNVGPWSAGCQVFADYTQWMDFHDLFKKAQTNWGSSFSYILINQSDLQ